MPFRIHLDGHTYLVHTEVSENACTRVVVEEQQDHQEPAPAQGDEP